MLGMQIRLLRPEFDRTCKSCQEWIYQDDGTIQRRAGQPVPRHPKDRDKTPCHKCPKLPADAPVKTAAYAEEITDRTRQTIQHYYECRAVGHWPDDPIVRRNAALIREVQDQADRSDFRDMLTKLALIKAGGGQQAAERPER